MKKVEKIHSKIISRKEIFNDDNLSLIMNTNLNEEDRKTVLEDYQWLKDYLKDYELEYDLMDVNQDNYPRYRSFLLGIFEEHSQKRSQSKSRSNSQAEVGKIEDVQDFAPAKIQKVKNSEPVVEDVFHVENSRPKKALKNEVEDIDFNDFDSNQKPQVSYVTKNVPSQEPKLNQAVHHKDVEEIPVMSDPDLYHEPVAQKVEDEFFDDWGEVNDSPKLPPPQQTKKPYASNNDVKQYIETNAKPIGPQTLPKSQPVVLNNTLPSQSQTQKSPYQNQPQNVKNSQPKISNEEYVHFAEQKSMFIENPDITNVYQAVEKNNRDSFAPAHIQTRTNEPDKLSGVEGYKPVENTKERDFFASFNEPKITNQLNTPKINPSLGAQEDINQNWPQLSNNPIISVISQLKPQKPPSSSTLLTSTLIQNLIPGDRPGNFMGSSLRPGEQKTFKVSSSFLKLNSDFYHKSDVVNPVEFKKAPNPILTHEKLKAVADLGSQLGGNFGEIAPNQPFKSIILCTDDTAQNKPAREKETTQSKVIKIELDDADAHIPLQKSRINASSIGDQLPFARSRFVPLTEAEKKPVQFRPISLNDGQQLLTSTMIGQNDGDSGQNSKFFITHYLDGVSRCECMSEPRFQQRLGFMTNFFRRVNDPSDQRIQKLQPTMRRFDSLMTKFEQEKNIVEVADEICKIENNWQCHSSSDPLQEKEKRRLWQQAEDAVKQEVILQSTRFKNPHWQVILVSLRSKKISQYQQPSRLKKKKCLCHTF